MLARKWKKYSPVSSFLTNSAFSTRRRTAEEETSSSSELTLTETL